MSLIIHLFPNHLPESLYAAYIKFFHFLFRFSPKGVPIYERDWDLLIVLDACRLDLMHDIADQYDFVEKGISDFRSIDTMTHPWMRKNFDSEFQDEMAETVYVCGSPFSDFVLKSGDFLMLDEVWKDCWDEDLGTIRARPITDRAIKAGRLHEERNRLIVHYLQPHHPFVPRPELDPGQLINKFNEEPWDDIWTRLRKGEVSNKRVWQAYRENLIYVLDDVEVLLENTNAERAVITSDHGNAFGEWGIYGHPMHTPLSCLQEVPWIETTAVDTGTHEPKDHSTNISADLDDRLRHLGYTN